MPPDEGQQWTRDRIRGLQATHFLCKMAVGAASKAQKIFESHSRRLLLSFFLNDVCFFDDINFPHESGLSLG